MKKSELIARLTHAFPSLSEADVKTSIEHILDAVASSLVSGQRVEIRGFGSFSLSYRQPRTARNPKTGASVSVQGKAVPHFKAGKELRERVVSPKMNFPREKRYRLDELLAQIPPGTRFEEIDWGPSVGQEIC